MGVFRNLLGTMLDTFGIGPKGARATLDASALSADRALALPDRAGMLALYGDPIALVVTQSGHGFVVGNAVCKSGAGWLTADRDSITRAAIGIVSEVVDNDTFVVTFAGVVALSTVEWDAVAGTSGGLTPGEFYCLSSTPGQITAAKPAAGILQWLLCADSATTAIVQLGEPFDRGTGEAIAATWTSILKETDEARNNTAAFADDAQLHFACEAGKRYHIRGVLLATMANATSGLKYQLSFSGTIAADFSSRVHIAAADGAANTLGTFLVDDTLPSGSGSHIASGAASRTTAFHMNAVLEAGTDGTLSFQWAQNTAFAGDTIVHAGSYIEYAVVGEQAGNTLAAAIGYDNSASGLTAETVQAALDELAESGGVFDLSTTAQLVAFDDFTGNIGSAPWVSSTTGSGQVASVDGGSGAPGVWRLKTGTTASANASVSLGSTNNVTLGGGEIELGCRFRFSHLSDGTNTFYAQLFGLLDTWDGTASNRIYAAYPSAGGSLTLFSRKAGVDTTDDCSTVLVAGVWYRLKLVISADGSEANLYIDDVLEATVSSGLPVVALRPGSLIGKSVGTAERHLDLDYFYATKTLTVPR